MKDVKHKATKESGTLRPRQRRRGARPYKTPASLSTRELSPPRRLLTHKPARGRSIGASLPRSIGSPTTYVTPFFLSLSLAPYGYGLTPNNLPTAASATMMMMIIAVRRGLRPGDLPLWSTIRPMLRGTGDGGSAHVSHPHTHSQRPRPTAGQSVQCEEPHKRLLETPGLVRRRGHRLA